MGKPWASSRASNFSSGLEGRYILQRLKSLTHWDTFDLVVLTNSEIMVPLLLQRGLLGMCLFCNVHKSTCILSMRHMGCAMQVVGGGVVCTWSVPLHT